MQIKVSSQHRQTKPVRTKRQSRNEGVLGLILSLTLLSPVAAQASQEPRQLCVALEL